MNLDKVQLAIRPRSILECLDVTFLFCGRHWLGLLLTGSIGIVPLASFNWLVANIQEMNGYAVYLLLTMEMPWATMFVTLYLGQATFSQRLSFRRMLHDGFRALPGMVAYQIIIRGAVLAIVVLAPLVFLGMYYLNEIILLEKPPVTRTWKRRTSMNSRIMGRILFLRLMDLAIMCGGTIALGNLFRAISSLWNDRLDGLGWSFLSLEESQDPLIFVDWETHAAFWVVILFLTVFRFVSYLDCRIRREGWDVELKLRSLAVAYQQREAVV